MLVAIAASSSAFWVSAGVTVAGLANLLVALTYVVQMLFGGVLLTLDTIPVWIRWLQYVSLFRYSIEAIVVNEVDGLYFNQTINGSSVLVPGSELLSFQGYKTSWLWYDMIGLGGLAVLFLTLTYITLRLIKKEK
ncbi:PREDICTED: ABC transporter G family member ARB_01379-like [Amphimedon queenslandica]|uniref:ABC-2 type transporter transmembrane domain-containing protein n=1 Tax=Amphimedon queenslandica TaxID=400682 RepID=A0A1X7T6T5_AMPQE|nr:PREDICTED: ABC transporter G family member ARB_01379-like [Amphimedon queenslandica]|eukprot:XP_011408115.2 PREDICTED: ABC transporter G family member ARB_01379-like [Amphimedon queenslandica]